jgi:hypothetical protein
MRVVKEIAIGGKTVEVRELTVADIRAWLKDMETAAPGADMLDVALFEDFGLDDLTRLTSLTRADMDIMTPTELRQVHAACKEVNGDFFGMRARLMEIGRAALTSPVSG